MKADDETPHERLHEVKEEAIKGSMEKGIGEMAKNMFEQNFDIRIILDITGFSSERLYN
jgi:hypothetical protein